MKIPTALLALGFGLLVASCSGAASLDEQVEALQAAYDAGSHEQVVTDAGPLLARCQQEQAGEAKSWKVEKLRLLALGRLARGKEATSELARLSASYPDKVKAELYAQVGGYVEEAGNPAEAIDVLDAGLQKHPDMKAVFVPYIEKCKASATASGDDATIAKLKALGYL